METAVLDSSKAALSVGVFATTLLLVFWRPRSVGRELGVAGAGLVGVGLTLIFGLVPVDLAANALRLLAPSLVTLICLMVLPAAAEAAGLLDALAERLASLANGSGWRLAGYLFLAASISSMLFTNDATILLFTPMTVLLMERVRRPDWGPRQELPFHFAVLYVGSLVGALMISNPINLVGAGFFHLSFGEYLSAMWAPALVSIAVSAAGLAIVFGRLIPRRCNVPEERPAIERPALLRATVAVLVIALVGFFTQSWTGLATWQVALAVALVMAAVHARLDGSRARRLLRDVAWRELVFVASIFIVVLGLRNAGFAQLLENLIEGSGGRSLEVRVWATAVTAAVSSALINNHPASDLMVWVIQGMELDRASTETLAYAALAGGNVGPRMLPAGSLAALIWMRLLRSRGVRIPLGLYVAVGIPLGLATLGAAIAVLLATRG